MTMIVIPVINEVEFSEVLKKIKIAETFSPWIHFDIADGKFTQNKTWDNPEEFIKFLEVRPPEIDVNIRRSNLPNIEVHLMVENPEKVIEDWVKTGAKRVIVHLEAVNMGKSDLQKLRNIREVGLLKIEIGLAINPDTPVENLIPFISPLPFCERVRGKFVQILAVNPGLAGQKFDRRVLEKIKFLKKHFLDVIIEVDGGINPETAKLVKEAGADIIASSTYIFGNPNPQKAYHELLES